MCPYYPQSRKSIERVIETKQFDTKVLPVF